WQRPKIIRAKRSRPNLRDRTARPLLKIIRAEPDRTQSAGSNGTTLP
ncbi:MAG: hypothetical protein AVDCRST_MAG56-7167, partial [uncultured Cytophagales bacterium]